MARNGKDLFVILAERQNRSNQKKSTKSGAKAESRTASASAAGSAAVGGVGRWVSSTVKSLRGGRAGDAGKAKTAESKPRSRGRRAAPLHVPRGLLVPGWLLVGMLVTTLGCGFAVGRFTSGGKSTEVLDSRSRGAAKPGAFQESTPGALSAAEEVEVLSESFYVVQKFRPDQRAEAAELARQLRARGLITVRIRSMQSGGSQIHWLTLCYVHSVADEKAGTPILKSLERFEDELDFRVAESRGEKLLSFQRKAAKTED